MRDEAKLGLGAALVAMLALGACAEPGDDADMAEDTAQASAPAPTTPRPVVSVAFQPGAGPAAAQVSGNADVFRGRMPAASAAPGDTGAADTGQPARDGFTLSVHLSGLTAGDHAWHIHSGPCGADGPVVVPFTVTPQGPGIDDPITVAAAGGMAMDTAFVPADRLTLDALQGSPHSLHVHARGGLDHGPTVACAGFGPGASGTGGSAPGSPAP